MKSTTSPVLRVVLDTNVLLSALVFNGGLARFRNLWTAKRILPYASKQTTQELILVLANNKFKLNAADQEGLLADYLPFAQVSEAPGYVVQTSLPICRDPKDQMFLNLAASAKADYLVTGDQDLLVLAETPGLPFRIIKPVEFLAQHQLPT